MNQQQYEYEVMSELELRDYFAAKAMAAFVVQTPFDAFMQFDEVSEGAYRLADTMIKHRKKNDNV